MSVTCSLSPDVNDPGFRSVNFNQLRQAYREQVLAMLEGGVDLILLETVFDTLNAKAALFAMEEVFDEQPDAAVPVMVSVTLTDKAGRTLSGQTDWRRSGIPSATSVPSPWASTALWVRI